MIPKKNARSSVKLDNLLKEGAAGRKSFGDIDKMVKSTTHRLMKEVILFKKQRIAHDAAIQYRNLGFSLLEPAMEQVAARRIADLVSRNKLPRSVLTN
ncbi:hypothetical protein Q1695_007932 [Nippostrongylus brasiliensis]|nr:hypothetical protein Q1695_007932 [Nippostrongylus brasiliensis]